MPNILYQTVIAYYYILWQLYQLSFYTSGELMLSVLDVAMMPYLRQK